MTSSAFIGGKEGLTSLVHLDQRMFVYLRREVSWVPRMTQEKRQERQHQQMHHDSNGYCALTISWPVWLRGKFEKGF